MEAPTELTLAKLIALSHIEKQGLPPSDCAAVAISFHGVENLEFRCWMTSPFARRQAQFHGLVQAASPPIRR
jgi:hypothetical protein